MVQDYNLENFSKWGISTKLNPSSPFDPPTDIGKKYGKKIAVIKSFVSTEYIPDEIIQI